VVAEVGLDRGAAGLDLPQQVPPERVVVGHGRLPPGTDALREA
jgi:hypothetical protein